MTLLVDVGNSAIKWAHTNSKHELIQPQWQLHRGVADIAAQLAECWRDVARGTPVVGCNVGGDKPAMAVERVARELALGAVRWMQSQPRFDGAVSLTNGYRNPLQLGADRWHCMLGACASSSSNRSMVVVNGGTATTVDCVETSEASVSGQQYRRRFIGGFIAPGVRLMLESLARETAGLPDASGDPDQFPDNTDAAIVSGVIDAQTGLVEHVWRRFASRVGSEPQLVLSGGNAPALLARLRIEGATIVDNLVLRGLALRV